MIDTYYVFDPCMMRVNISNTSSLILCVRIVSAVLTHFTMNRYRNVTGIACNKLENNTC